MQYARLVDASIELRPICDAINRSDQIEIEYSITNNYNKRSASFFQSVTWLNERSCLWSPLFIHLTDLMTSCHPYYIS